MSRGLRNNNPGNIRIDNTKWQGEVIPSQDKAFKQFETMAYGYRAMFVLLNTYQKKYGLNTIRKMIVRYAPPNENHTDTYVNKVSEWSGVGPDVQITPTNKDVMIPVVSAMSRMENGAPANIFDVRAGWELFIKGLK